MKNYLFIIGILMSLSSCTHKFYYPMTNHVPTHEGANELSLTGGYNIGEEVEAVEVQAAYSLTEQIGLMGNFLYGYGGNKGTGDYGNGYMADLGIGYFMKQNNFYASIYGGGGLSNQQHYYFQNSENYLNVPVTFYNGFIQPALGISTKYFEALLSMRVSLLSYRRVDNILDPMLNEQEYLQLNTLNEFNPFYIIQPALTLRGGLPNLKLQTQLGFTRELNNRQIYFDGYMSAGIVYIFNRKS